MSKVALAELLLRRKELQEKVTQLHTINNKDLHEIKVRRQSVTESVDEVAASVPKLDAAQVTAEYDYYATRLRKVDALIQRTNWETQVETEDTLMANYKAEAK
jgi:di/tripeptidase